jgi:cation diffusion facilitator family transporter
VSESSYAGNKDLCKAAERGKEQFRRTVWVTGIGAAVNLLLAVGKIIVGLALSVQAVFADGVHSLSDLLSDGILLLFVRLSHRPRSRACPYGHRKWESMAAIGIAFLLVVVAGGMVWHSVMNTAAEADRLTGWLPLTVLLASIFSKEWLYRYTLQEGKRIRSTALIANAWHHRSDALSSMAVLFCFAMAFFFGRATLWDKIGVIMVATMILRAAWEIGHGAMEELLDYAPSLEVLNRIEAIADEDPDVIFVHDVRVRSISKSLDILLSVELLESMTIKQAHEVVHRIEEAIARAVEGVVEVFVHVEPAGSFMARLHAEGLENVADEELL